MRRLVLLAAIGLCGLAACTSVWETPMPTAAVLTATPLSTPTALPYAGGPPGAGWALVFEDDFDGTALDTSKWRTCYAWASDEGCTNSSNEELQWYQKDDVIVSQGTLRLRAQRRSVNGYRYTSGMISSQGSFSFRYGYCEARARVPKGRGLWAAFWVAPEDNRWPPEIDVLETLGQQPNTVHLTHHWREESRAGPSGFSQTYTGPDFTAEFHTFGLLWEPGQLVWYVDGVERHRVVHHVPAEPFYLVANLAVGGSWAGAPDSDTPFPSDYEIDYIRVWQRATGPA